MPYNLNPKLEKQSKIGDPQGIAFIIDQIMANTTSVDSLKVLAKSSCNKKPLEIEASLLLLESMGLIRRNNGIINSTDILVANYNADNKLFVEWFIDVFIDFVMHEHIIDVESIVYEIGIDAFVMSQGSIKMRYAGYRNMLVDFGIISLRSDARYTILRKLDRYLTKPEVYKPISEKQLLANLQKKKELGEEGETYVLEYEKRRITNPYLNNKIKRISIIDVGAGYDIVSFNDNDSTQIDRFIEVKTYRGNEHFHWSRNEIEKAHMMGAQYFLYLVDADCIPFEDYEPTIIQDPIKQIGESEGWVKRPDSYLVERVIEAKMHENLPLFSNIEESFRGKQSYPYLYPVSDGKQSVVISTSKIDITASQIGFNLGNVSRDFSKLRNKYDCNEGGKDGLLNSFSSLVVKPICSQGVIKKLHELVDCQIEPKYVVMPIRAAMEAGVIRRPTWGEFCAEFGDNKLKAKSSLSNYTENSYQYEGESFKVMVEEFRSFLN